MTRIKLRRGTSKQWFAANPVLAAGEPGFDLDAGLLKIGNGVGTWSELIGLTNLSAAAESAAAYFAARRIVLLEDFGGRFDRRPVILSSVAGSREVSSNGLFTPEDAGRYVVLPGAGDGRYAGNLITQIVSVQSDSLITVTGASSASVSGAFGFIGTSNDQAWKGAIEALGGSGGSIQLPAGHGMHMVQKTLPDNVSVVGAGMDVTVIHPVGIVHGFYRATTQGDVSSPPTNIHWRDLTVDGSMQTAGAKGWYMNHMVQCTWTDVKCVNTGASGFGVDFLQDCWFTRCWAEECGRLGTLDSPGCSGFGIGMGVWDRENSYLIACVARANRRHGAFFENQPSAKRPSGVQVIGGRFEGNGLTGISDQTVTGLIVTGAHLVDNGGRGFSVTTTSALNNIGIDGSVSDCVITGNREDGVLLDWTHTPLPVTGRYRIKNNLIKANRSDGVAVRSALQYGVDAVEISGNVIEANARHGVSFRGGRFNLTRVRANTILDNGSPGFRQAAGISVQSVMSASDLSDNICSDSRSGKSKTQAVGIALSSDSKRTFEGRITGNELRGNRTAALTGQTRISRRKGRLRSNDGLNPLGIDKKRPQKSPSTHVGGPTEETHYLSGGGVMAVSVNGSRVFTGRNQGLVTVSVSPGDKLKVKFDSAPDWKIYRH